MRFYFPNTTRVKKASARLSGIFPSFSLSKWQSAISVALGYRDWHEFERGHKNAEPSILDQHLSEQDFRSRTVAICLSLSKSTGIADSDLQYALQFVRLTGDRPFSQSDHEAIRCSCWRATSMPWTNSRGAGAIVSAVAAGRRRHAYLRRPRIRGGTAMCVTDNSIDACFADFEISSPRTRAPDFVPMRLYLPYGYWVRGNGTKILFSRNYKPLWEIRESGEIIRALPWEWVDDIKVEDWFGGSKYAELTFYNHMKSLLGSEILMSYKISGLPILTEILPIVIRDDERSFDDAVEKLRREWVAANARASPL